jgi:hypothetical protein
MRFRAARSVARREPCTQGAASDAQTIVKEQTATPARHHSLQSRRSKPLTAQTDAQQKRAV